MQTKWTKGLTDTRFVQGDRRKFNKKLFYGDLEASYCAGVLGLIEELQKEHLKNPYDTIDEMLGDLQLLHVELFNDFAGKNGINKTSLF
jgi:hypothetical protein